VILTNANQFCLASTLNIVIGLQIFTIMFSIIIFCAVNICMIVIVLNWNRDADWKF
jgi:hypothetical protein